MRSSRGRQTFSVKDPDSKYFRLCGPYFHRDHSAPLLQRDTGQNQYTDERVGLCSNKTWTLTFKFHIIFTCYELFIFFFFFFPTILKCKNCFELAGLTKISRPRLLTPDRGKRGMRTGNKQLRLSSSFGVYIRQGRLHDAEVTENLKSSVRYGREGMAPSPLCSVLFASRVRAEWAASAGAPLGLGQEGMGSVARRAGLWTFLPEIHILHFHRFTSPSRPHAHAGLQPGDIMESFPGRGLTIWERSHRPSLVPSVA